MFAVNKLDAVENAEYAFTNISAALNKFTSQAKIKTTAIVPISALKGWNVVDAKPGWASYSGPSLLQVLESLSTTPAETDQGFSFPVQWVEKFSSSADTSQGRRIFWGRVATGRVQVGQTIAVFPSGKTATVAQVLDRARRPESVYAGQSAGIVLDREVDVSRGDWILEQEPNISSKREIKATIAWLDDEPLVAGRAYWALHGHRWVKAKIKRVVHKLDIHTLAELEATLLAPNDIGHVEIVLQEPIVNAPYSQSRHLGSLVLVDTASHRTAGAVLIS